MKTILYSRFDRSKFTFPGAIAAAQNLCHNIRYNLLYGNIIQEQLYT